MAMTFLTDAEYKRIAKTLNQRMVQAEHDGRTNDPQYKQLQHALKKIVGATKSASGNYRFPVGIKQKDESTVSRLKQIANDYTWALFATDKSKLDAIRRRAKELKRNVETEDIAQYLLDRSQKFYAKTGKESAKLLKAKATDFDKLWVTFRQSDFSRATGPFVSEIKRRFKKYLDGGNVSGYSSLSDQQKDLLLQLLVKAVLLGHFPSSYSFDSEQEIETMVTNIKDTPKEIDEKTIDFKNRQNASYYVKLLDQWNMMDFKSRQQFNDDFNEYFKTKWQKN